MRLSPLSLLLCGSILSVAACTSSPRSAKDDGTAISDSIPAAVDNRTATISFAFVGDVLMGTNYPSEAYVTRDRGASLFVDCKDILSAADVAIANLEGTCYDGTDGEIRKGGNPKTTFIFRMPGDHAHHLTDAGIDAVNFANNHSFDFGATGRRNTLKKMEEVGVKVAGIRDLAEGCILERHGLRIAYVSFAANCTQVLDLNDKAEVEAMVKKYREQSDILVVGFHGGAEGTAYMHVPGKVEYFLGECRGDVKAFAHQCIDLGADIVVGHGPHVPRAMELYKGHLIAYSLGNFCGPYRLGMKGATGHAPLLTCQLNSKDGTLRQGKIHSFQQQHGVGPRLDASQAALKDIKTLTQQDFPSTPLLIEDDGSFKPKAE